MIDEIVDEIYTIYKATNIINGKCYIGFTSNFHNRLLDHRKNFRNKNSKKYYNKFYCAIRKYGWDNFQWEFLYQSKDKDHCLSEMETYFIKEYNSFALVENSNGYNLTLGGEGTPGIVKSERSKKHHSEKMKGRKFTEEHKSNISNSLKGKKRTPEHCKNLSESQKGDKNWQTKRMGELHPKSKKYIGVSPTGEVFSIFGMREFCRKNNMNSGNAIQCARGKKKSYKNWKFFDYDDELFNNLKLKENEIEN